MKKYHMTENKYLYSISKNGLTPQRGIRNQLINDPKCAVFYSEGYEGTLTMFFKIWVGYQQCRESDERETLEEYMKYKRQFKEVLLKKQVRKNQGLYCKLRKSKRRYKTIRHIKVTKDYREFLGEGVCLSLENINDENNSQDRRSFCDSWTYQTVQPQDIKVVVLKNKLTNEIISSKYDVIMFFASQVPLNELIERTWKEDLETSTPEDSLLMKIMSKYYEKNTEQIRQFSKKYEYAEMSLEEYMKRKKDEHDDKETR